MPSFMRYINIIGRCGGMYRAKRLKDTDLGAEHHSYILAICRHPGITQEQLAKHICVNKSNVARQLSYLEEHGYAERRQSENDRRVLLVYPTQKALEVLPFLREILQDWNTCVTDELSAEELETLQALLRRVAVRSREYFGDEEGME